MIGWVLFRSETFSGALLLLKSLLGARFGEPSPVWRYATTDVLIALAVGAAVSLGAGPALARAAERLAGGLGDRKGSVVSSTVAWTGAAATVLLLALAVVTLAGGTITSFIYFQF
jgi:hypothetical protein